MNILVLGSGGREHSICEKLKKSKKIKNIYCSPGNAGIGQVAKIPKININNFKNVLDFCKIHKISIVIPGSEVFLEKGISDFLQLNGIEVIGPSKFASQLETSKYFTKQICSLAEVKTAKWLVFVNAKEAKKSLKNKKFPLVIKMDSLAAGKGVLVAKTLSEANKFLNKIIKGSLGNSDSKIIIEECLYGEEGSFFFAVDGLSAKFLGSAKDYKTVGEGNKGLNTGGMGCISPSPKENKKVIDNIIKDIINPTLKIMLKLGYPYKGFLYAGVMFTKKGIYLIEYNVRLGDPECQAILARIETDLVDICIAVQNKTLKKINIIQSKQITSCVVIATRNYPEEYKKNIKIFGLNKVNTKNNITIYHAGTRRTKTGKFVTNGGRVLNIVSNGKDLMDSVNKGYEEIKKIKWKGSFYRKDIGS